MSKISKHWNTQHFKFFMQMTKTLISHCFVAQMKLGDVFFYTLYARSIVEYIILKLTVTTQGSTKLFESFFEENYI